MERPRRKLFVALGIIVLLVAFIMIHEAFFGYTTYLFIVPTAKLFADGKPAPGWLHRGSKCKCLIVTRIASGKRESYWIQHGGKSGGWGVRSCGEWSAGRFPLIAIGDVNPPCPLIFADPGTRIEGGRSTQALPVFGTQFMKFTAENGDELKVTW